MGQSGNPGMVQPPDNDAMRGINTMRGWAGRGPSQLNSGPMQPTMGPQPQGMTAPQPQPQPQQPMGGGFGGNNPYAQVNQYMNQAGQTYSSLTGAPTPTVTGTPQGWRGYTAQTGMGAVSPVAAGLVGRADLGRYENPYTDTVIDRTMSDMDRARQMAITDNQRRATMSGAFGGSRHGVADSLTNERFADAVGDMSAELRAAGYDRATTLAGQDIDRTYGADTFNRTMYQSAGLADQAAVNASRAYGAGAYNAASGANAGRDFAAQMANQGTEMANRSTRMSAAGNLEGLAGAREGMLDGAVSGVGRQGAIDQAMMQQLIDAAQRQYGGFTQSPYQASQAVLGALGVAQQGPNNTTTTTSERPGFVDYFAALAPWA